ncbi:uncharacterized protein EI90DRAFT_3054326 [Cantharellus anzutake]|uniref:uncharacterized protein n=1 Tax=Cantharellus anzutake TaxID=1750568 RepID=UPI0019056E5A|nr:uncharacterized protein EI90DRAFT_3054326 [Cantharellus anzutake]KAF8332766.1 hypothetical protein EI90DRAFT_3054326 [Cantharellus anzutake]
MIELNASEQSIEKVTVYNDRATVQRRFQVDLKSGQNDISITRLPGLLDPDSIRVETESVDTFQLLTVLNVVSMDPREQTQDLSLPDPLSELEDQRSALSNHLRALRDAERILSDYAHSMSAKHATSEQLVSFIDTHIAQNKKLHVSITEARKEMRTVERRLSEMRLKNNSQLGRLKYAGVDVVLDANKDGNAWVILSYIVTNASWYPVYDIRADIDSQLASNAKNPPTMNIHYRASISQSTGEDWDGVTLTLSTTSPLTGSVIPTLRPWNIGTGSDPRLFHPATVSYDRDIDKVYSRRERPRSRSPVRSRRRTHTRTNSSRSPRRNRSWSPSRSWRPNTPREPTGEPRHSSRPRVTAWVKEGAIGSTFEIESPSTIPSGGSSHRVSIASLDLPSTLTWVTVPRKTTAAFLQCNIKNTSPYVLLAGPSNIFMDGNFVCKSELPNVSPQEDFSCSLGVDPSLRIIYQPQRRNVRTQGGSFLSRTPKRQITSVNQQIRIKNTRPSAISRLIVRDQIPNSQDSRIKVSVVNPDEKLIGAPSQSYSIPGGTGANSGSTNGLEEKLHYTLQNGVIAQWAQKHEDVSGGYGGAKGDGIIEWICSDVEAVLDLELEYEVSAPQGLDWK